MTDPSWSLLVLTTVPPGNSTPLLLLLEPAVLSFDADHPVVAELIVGAALDAAEETAVAAARLLLPENAPPT